MPTWPSDFKHLTVEQAWGFARGDTALSDVPGDAKLELAGLSAFGESGRQAETLDQSVAPISEGGYPPSWNVEHIRSGLVQLGISDPEKNRDL